MNALNCAVVSAATKAGVSKGICSGVGKIAELVLELDKYLILYRGAVQLCEPQADTLRKVERHQVKIRIFPSNILAKAHAGHIQKYSPS